MTPIAPRPAVFVDRDNTLIDDPGYLHDPGQVRLLPGAAESIRRLHDAGFPVIVVTNQSGVARGHITEEQLAAVHRRLEELLAADRAAVDAIYYCPYLDGPGAVKAEYRVDSDLRKPRPGMLLLAAREHAIDLARSWMVGDSDRDIQAGRAAGCRTVLLSPNGHVASARADHVASDFSAAVDRILNDRGGTPVAGGVAPSSHKSQAASLPTGGSAAGESAVSGGDSTSSPANRSNTEALLQQIADELRGIRRERHFSQFSLGHLAGAIAQAFALCSVGWGIYAGINGADESAKIRLLAGIAFQLLAVTCFVASGHR